MVKFVTNNAVAGVGEGAGGGGRVQSRSLLCSRKRLLLLYCEKGIIDFSEPDYANIHKLMLNFG